MKRRVVFSLSVVVLLVLLSISKCQAQEWVPYVPSSQSVDLQFWMLDGISYINVSIGFGDPCYDVDWGTVVREEYEIWVNSTIWDFTGGCVDIPTTFSHTYNLTRLEEGNYTFTFMVWNVTVKSINLTVVRTIYIRADGSIDPPTAPILSVDNVTYTFTDNIYDHSIVVERDNIVVDGAGYILQGTGNRTGIDLSDRSNVTIKNVEIEKFSYGIYLNHSASNSIVGNTITANNFEGIRLYETSNNNITGNDIVTNDLDGIVLYGSSKNTIAKNDLMNNYDGIRLYESSNNSIAGNIIANNYYGISLTISANNSIYENNIENNNRGIHLRKSSNNKIYHNNFNYNNQQVFLSSSGYANIWDDGYPSGGNFWWRDHNPPDIYSGPYQNETGRDEIGDTPYIIDENNTDRYPLIYPYGYVPTIDLNNDGTINIIDIVKVAIVLFSEPGDPNWNPYADLNQDSLIGIIDIVMVAIHFDEPYP